MAPRLSLSLFRDDDLDHDVREDEDRAKPAPGRDETDEESRENDAAAHRLARLQLKPTIMAGPTDGTTTADASDPLYAKAAVTSVTAARQSIASALAAVDASMDMAAILAGLSATVAHLEHAERATRAIPAPDASFAKQMDSFSSAYLWFLEAYALSDAAHPTLDAMIANIGTREQTLRAGAGLDPAVEKRAARPKKAGKPDGVSIKPTLAVVRHAGDAAVELLRGGADRQTTVGNFAGGLTYQLDHAAWQLEALDEETRKGFVSAVEAASDPINRIYNWIIDRSSKKKILGSFDGVIDAAERCRKAVGLGSIAHMAAPEETTGDKEDRLDDKTMLDNAIGGYESAWGELSKRMSKGLETWETLAGLKSQEKTGFFEALLQAVVTAAIGNIGGAVVKAIAGKAGDTVADVLSGVASDTSQAMLAPAFDSGAAKSSSLKSEEKSRAYFIAALDWSYGILERKEVDAMAKAAREGETSIAEVEQATKALTDKTEVALAEAIEEASIQWARYCVRAKLTDGDEPTGEIPGDAPTDLDGYFGELKEVTDKSDPHMYRKVKKQVGSHEGTLGMFRIVLHIPDGTLDFDVLEAKVHGMNQEMAYQIAKSADFTIGKLEVPKEIHVRIGDEIEGRYPTQKLAVDEKGNVQSEAYDHADADNHTGVNLGAAMEASNWDAIAKLVIPDDKIR